jgi:hypothetical protein
MMVVDERYCTVNFGVRRLPYLSHQLVTDQIAKGLGAIRVPAAFNEFVEFLQQVAIYGHADST